MLKRTFKKPLGINRKLLLNLLENTQKAWLKTFKLFFLVISVLFITTGIGDIAVKISLSNTHRAPFRPPLSWFIFYFAPLFKKIVMWSNTQENGSFNCGYGMSFLLCRDSIYCCVMWCFQLMRRVVLLLVKVGCKIS